MCVPPNRILLPVPGLVERRGPGLRLGVPVEWIVGIRDPEASKGVVVGERGAILHGDGGTIATDGDATGPSVASASTSIAAASVSARRGRRGGRGVLDGDGDSDCDSDDSDQGHGASDDPRPLALLAADP